MSTLLYWLDPWEPSPTVVIAVLVAGILFARGARHARDQAEITPLRVHRSADPLS